MVAKEAAAEGRKYKRNNDESHAILSAYKEEEKAEVIRYMLNDLARLPDHGPRISYKYQAWLSGILSLAMFGISVAAATGKIKEGVIAVACAVALAVMCLLIVHTFTAIKEVNKESEEVDEIINELNETLKP